MTTSPQTVKIAIIEDDAAIRQLYEFKFESEGFTVKSADNGKNGLALVESFQPHLILLDLRMPVMNGDEMLMRMRSEDWGGGVRVIILTNISRDEAPRTLRFLSIDRYVVKAHHTPKQIVEVAKEILGIRL